MKLMAIRLIDRSEKVLYKGNVYELTLYWDRESIGRCFCGMPPFLAYIRKDGINFATIDCTSGRNDCFFVEKFKEKFFVKAEWQVRFAKDINTIPFVELLKGLPL